MLIGLFAPEIVRYVWHPFPTAIQDPGCLHEQLRSKLTRSQVAFIALEQWLETRKLHVAMKGRLSPLTTARAN
jgi:hypothetical protein